MSAYIFASHMDTADAILMTIIIIFVSVAILVYYWITEMIQKRLEKYIECGKGDKVGSERREASERAIRNVVYAWWWFWIVWIVIMIPLWIASMITQMGVRTHHASEGEMVVHVLFGLWFFFGNAVWISYQIMRDNWYHSRRKRT